MERHSKQRDAIIAELQSRCDHPTAMELYLSVKKTIPNLSLGTLYRNLSKLEENDMLIRVHDNTNDRFDGNTSPHAHFKCTTCGKVYDIFPFKNDLTSISDENISQIYSSRLTLFGLCKSCDENCENKN